MECEICGGSGWVVRRIGWDDGENCPECGGTGVRKTMKYCRCGRRMSKYSNECRRCHDEKMDRLQAEARKIVATGICPRCGSELRRNLSIIGWWQCEQFGAETHRARPQDPACNFQTFTE